MLKIYNRYIQKLNTQKSNDMVKKKAKERKQKPCQETGILFCKAICKQSEVIKH